MPASQTLAMASSAHIAVRDLSPTPCHRCHVRHLALFQAIPDEELSESEQFREEQFDVAPHEQLYLENHRPGFSYSLFSGWVALYKTLDDGSRQILKFALPGDLLGFNLSENGTATHSAEAITDVRVCAFPTEKVTEMLRNQPEIAPRLAQMTARDMSMCQQHLMCTSKRDARERLAYLFLETFQRVKRQAPEAYFADQKSIYFPVTQELIGDALGLTNVHVSRIVKVLKNDGLIDCRQKRLTIIDEARLAEVAQFDLAHWC